MHQSVGDAMYARHFMTCPPLPRLLRLSTTAVGLSLALGWVWQAQLYQPPTHIPVDIVYQYRRQYTPGQIQPGWRLLSVGRRAEIR